MQSQCSLPEVGFVRLAQILVFVPISKSSWWLGVAEGRFPRPLKLGPRTTVWRVEDIRALITDGVQLLDLDAKVRANT